jgi:endonuclease G, mitochondrial
VFDGNIKWPVGTAWMAAPGIAVTNRHVAETFAFLDDAGNPAFLPDDRNRPYRATVDFAEEHGSSAEREIAVTEVVYMAKRGGGEADLALLRLAPSDQLPRPIPLLGADPAPDDWMAVVGYPQPDNRIPPAGRAVEESYFGNVYGVKRLSAGQIDPSKPGLAGWALQHDATTLGGSSGSVLIDLKTGAAAGVHFKGEYRIANYAVRASELAKLLSAHGIASTSVLPAVSGAAAQEVSEGGEEAAAPLTGFDGYKSGFIVPGDAKFEVPLPKVTSAAPGTIAKLKDGGDLLKYRNFTVQMRQDRRYCYYSAVNIDGNSTFSIGGQRPPWKFDDRMDRKFQIKAECYGNESDGKFSRGHMTRREDPNWGPTREDAAISNGHTFFVTNACPQVQPFNAGVWLSLEDYALENCDQDNMRISVFTGPICRETPPDPVYFGVKVPIEFWKIIAFKHDETKELVATGYRMSQRNLLPTQEEFTFGQFSQSQVTIKFIEGVTGLSFHQLREHDPMDDGTESPGTTSRPLRTPRDLVFKRAG